MWFHLSRFILDFKKVILLVFIFVTAFWIYEASQIRIAFNPGKILPKQDSAYIDDIRFKQKFGEDGKLIIIGTKTPQLFEKNFFNQWAQLSNDLGTIKGVEKVVSLSNFKVLVKDSLKHQFDSRSFFSSPIQQQQTLDSLKNELAKLPFYQGVLINQQQDASIIAITLSDEVLKNAQKNDIVNQIDQLTQKFENQTKVAIHSSGLVYIKTVLSKLVAKEFILFLGLSIVIALLVLLYFFRNWHSVLFPILFVLTGVIWSLGLMALLNYEITILSGVIAPLMVIIGLPNCILIYNQFHSELQKSVRKSVALKSTIEKIAFTTFIANLTTAIGFAVLAFTNSAILQEFGIIAAAGVMGTWLICICMLPIACSFLQTPKVSQKGFGQSLIKERFLIWVIDTVNYHRKYIYYAVSSLIIVASIGIYQLKINAFVVDDLPKDHPVYTDLKFFENNFGGILPLEISIDSKKKNGILRSSNIKKIAQLDQTLSQTEGFGNSVSVLNAFKYASQVFYNNDAKYYRIPSEMESAFIFSYVAKADENQNMMNGFVDKNRQTARLTFPIKDIGSAKMNHILTEIQPKIDSIFNPKKYDVTVTGPVVLFVKGSNYLVKNLRESLLLAIALIAFIMWLLFRGVKMIIISLLPNLIPLLITAGIMGIFGISLKPSTILIFSIALGIASDQTIYFLTRYLHSLSKGNLSSQEIINYTIKETGLSMVYTAIILFFGFGIFVFSTFGGTVALGLLLSLTLLVAILFNLLFLPALLIDFKPFKTRD